MSRSFKEGDCWARAYVALEEMKQSVKILRQAFKNIPPGPVRLKLGPQPRVPAGEVYFRTRGRPRGAGLPSRQRRVAKTIPAEDGGPELQEHDRT